MVARQTLVKNIVDLLEQHNPEQVSKVVAEYLLKNNRTSELQSILRDVSIVRREDKKIVEVTAISAHALSEENYSEIKAKVNELYPDAREVTVNSRIDHSLIGGVRLEFPDSQLDMSVESRITRLRKLVS
jgi:ATP synthase F1 delta subunit